MTEEQKNEDESYTFTIIQPRNVTQWIKFTLKDIPGNLKGDELIEKARICLVGYSNHDTGLTVKSLGDSTYDFQSKAFMINKYNATKTIKEIMDEYNYDLNGKEIYAHWDAGGCTCMQCILCCCCCPCVLFCDDACSIMAMDKEFELPKELVKVWRGGESNMSVLMRED